MKKCRGWFETNSALNGTSHFLFACLKDDVRMYVDVHCIQDIMLDYLLDCDMHMLLYVATLLHDKIPDG